MNISLQLARPHNPDTAVIAQFKYDGKKRRLGLDGTVPSERWNKGKQRLKVLTDQWEQLRPRDRIAQAVAEQVNGRVGVVSEHEPFSVGGPQGQFTCRVTHCNVHYHKMSTQEGLT